MRRITAGICLVAGVVSSGISPALSQDAIQLESDSIDQTTLPDATDLKGARPKAACRSNCQQPRKPEQRV